MEPAASEAEVEDLTALAIRLEGSGDYRVLRRFVPPTMYEPCGSGERAHIGAVVDIETTGLAPDAVIIELGIAVFEFCSDGRVVRVREAANWLEDPGCPLPPEIVALTGITDAMVRGQRIDEATVEAMLEDVVLIVAHNAEFDRPRLERRFPFLAQRRWGCSCREIDWAAEGFRHASLEYIGLRLGFYIEGAHRAATDCLATVHALSHRLPVSGQRALDVLLLSVRRPTWRVWALGTPIAVKDALKGRGYRWSDGTDGRPRCWYIDVADDTKQAELDWLANIAPGCDPALRRLTALDRWSDRSA